MKTTVNFCDFQDAFHTMGRGNQFTYKGKKALYEWIEYMDEECDTETELDVIALCCEFTEYEDLEEFHSEYSKEEYPALEVLADYTTVIPIEGTESFIIAQF